ncbi:cell wall metabolism sensor histidine kinase WalK [Marinoscillum sp. MHG1-6]|uniref:sensor histidine kinase n=1 Tax=Marinoscillum sp. MHG1-6 TaxID=2959627 RepID=UPI00215859D6|nr:ATP-binding protein [Marinoscillum sp. MHG1-6]
MINSRGISLLLALIISIITTAFISMVESVNDVAVTIAFFLSFSTSYIFILITLEFIFFRQINSIFEVLENIRDMKDQDLSFLIKSTAKTSFNPLKNVNKEIFNYAEQKQQEIIELKQLEAFRREFMADVSHELKTPIFAAQGFVHTLLDGAIEDKKVRKKFLKKAAKSLDGLDILVHELLTISQMETGEIKMHYEHFDIVQMCKEVEDQLEGKAAKKDIEITISGEVKKHFVYADFHRIYQVLTNLISNAVKYTRKGGKVWVDFEEKHGSIYTYVKDNGRGIPKEDINRIFERFYRVDKSRSKEKGGTGLGLAIVKHIMEAHDSKVSVESEYKKGSVFSFALKKGKPVSHRFVYEEDDEDED